MKSFTTDRLTVRVFDSVEAMAATAAADFAAAVNALLRTRDAANVVFAGAQSQMAFHAALVARRDIPWPRIDAISVDEFHAPGIPPELAVCAQPRRDLYSRVPLRSVTMPDFAAPDAEAERARFQAAIAHRPLHLACLGVGVSGHLAFNEPGPGVFDEPQAVKVVDVAESSKRQLMADPNFAALGTIPARGITMTVPTLMSAGTILCCVPYRIKAGIIRDLLAPGVRESLPATILKTHPGATLYLDVESSSLWAAPGASGTR
ncbi:MAG: Glucosamine-6-phosphate deaminase [Phycisphaerae bacterium]|nr:Glucosamine-6-phosphate deaminase [Phycisphaerae bacterium]